MSLLNLFGFNKSNAKLEEALERNAVVLDVRTPQEYQSGHVKGSINIPLQVLNKQLSKVKKHEGPIITVCRSGARSAKAAGILAKQGIEAYNGGGWESFSNQYMSKN